MLLQCEEYLDNNRRTLYSAKIIIIIVELDDCRMSVLLNEVEKKAGYAQLANLDWGQIPYGTLLPLRWHLLSEE
jgi:hypothetical protein